MKLGIKIVIILLVILILLFSTVYIFIAIKGKSFLAQKLEDALKKEVSIAYLGLKLPLALEIKDLKIKELANVDYIYASVQPFGLLGGKIILNEVKILRPEINWVRRPPASAEVKDGPIGSMETEDKPVSSIERALTQTKELLNSPRRKDRQPPPIIIKYLTVEGGTINFTDQTISEPGIQITLKELLVDVDNLYLLPKSAVTNFQLTAKIPWQEDSEEGTVYTSGWINLYRKDIQARLEIEGIDGVYLHPYYSQWVDLENSRIKEANLNLTSDIQGQNNDIVVQCRLELTDIKFRPRPPEQPEHKAEKITTAILGIFRALNQGRIVLNFTIRTKMDRPEFKFNSINKALDETLSQAAKSGQVKVEDMVLLPAKIFEGVAKGTSGATKAIIEGAIAVGKSFLDAFKVEEEQTEESEEEETQQKNLFQD